jgi:hypothetical protein
MNGGGYDVYLTDDRKDVHIRSTFLAPIETLVEEVK